MEAVSYTSIRGTYTIRQCVLEDIDGDVSSVKIALTNAGEVLTNEDEYINNMLDSIYCDMAVCVELNGERVGFIYLKKDSNLSGKLIAASLHCEDTVGFLLMLLTIPMEKYYYIMVFPHGKNFVQFKAILTRSSIIKYNKGVSNYVVIKKTRSITRKFELIAKALNVKEVI